MYNISIYYYADEIQIRTYLVPVTTKEEREIDDKNLEEDNFPESPFGEVKKVLYDTEDKKEEKVNRERSIQSSYNRTKQSIYGIARANEWEYFVTLTINPERMDRSNLDGISKRFNDFMGNLKKRKSPDLKYIFVPELHKDGINYHLHGLIANCDGCTFKDSGKKDSAGRTIYNFENWKFGFSTATKVTDTHRASSYITKYITKELCSVGFNKRRYWCSKNCLKADDVKEELNLSSEEIDSFIKNLYNENKIIYEKSVKIESIGQCVNYYEVKMI